MIGESVIRIRGLAKAFGRVQALDGVDLTVERGEVFGYLGPNGAGKSTTIRILLGFLGATAGEALVFGGSGREASVRARIGYLPGDLRIDRRYSARDLVSFFARLRNMDRLDYAWELCERFGLDPGRPAGELSTGNRRKLGIIQAFMHRPELLILDEPTSGLDPLLQHEFQVLVRESLAGGATVFLSSHILPEVQELAARVAILRKGRVVTVAGVHELQARARQRIDLYVAGDVAAAELARAPGVVSAEERDGHISVLVQGSADGLIKAAARHEVRRIETHGGDLEELFLSYYEEAER